VLIKMLIGDFKLEEACEGETLVITIIEIKKI
jgi:hypothetical protein